jgi:hypothetical protein
MPEHNLLPAIRFPPSRLDASPHKDLEGTQLTPCLNGCALRGGCDYDRAFTIAVLRILLNERSVAASKTILYPSEERIERPRMTSLQRYACLVYGLPRFPPVPGGDVEVVA